MGFLSSFKLTNPFFFFDRYSGVITYFLIEFTMDFFLMVGVIYALAMASTAYAVLLGCAVEEPKLGQEMLPLLFVPQMLFAGVSSDIRVMPFVANGLHF